jgi:hypothetical protein
MIRGAPGESRGTPAKHAALFHSRLEAGSPTSRIRALSKCTTIHSKASGLAAGSLSDGEMADELTAQGL